MLMQLISKLCMHASIRHTYGHTLGTTRYKWRWAGHMYVTQLAICSAYAYYARDSVSGRNRGKFVQRRRDEWARRQKGCRPCVDCRGGASEALPGGPSFASSRRGLHPLTAGGSGSSSRRGRKEFDASMRGRSRSAACKRRNRKGVTVRLG